MGGEKAPDWPRLGNLLTKLRRAAVAGLRRLVVVVLVGESRDLYLESRGCCEANAPTHIREYHEQICPAASEENSYFHSAPLLSVNLPFPFHDRLLNEVARFHMPSVRKETI